MKMAIIGTTSYQDKMEEYIRAISRQGHIAKMPVFDDQKDYIALDILEHNRQLVEWADEVHVFWNARSTGTIFDFGMAFALKKPLRIVYLEPKRFDIAMEQYARIWVDPYP